tara:strand:+ start:118 stop:258 length:141 start_codon:yes stop_codon:yes gene_type:complete
LAVEARREVEPSRRNKPTVPTARPEEGQPHEEDHGQGNIAEEMAAG